MDLFDLDVIPRFTSKLLPANEVVAGAGWLDVVVRAEGGVVTGHHAL